MSTVEIYTQNIANLEAALANDTLSCSYDGKSMTFASADDLLKRLKYCRTRLRELGGKGSGPRRTTVYTNSRKGL